MNKRKTLGNVDERLKQIEKRQKSHEKEDDTRFAKRKAPKKKSKITLTRV